MNSSIASGFKLGVKVGGKELAFSGFTHLDCPEVLIEVNDITYEFRFRADSGASRYVSTIEEGNNKKLIIELYNHTNSLGEGEYSPMLIGKMAGRQHYLTYAAYTVNAEKHLRRLEFAFYLGDAS